MGGSTSGNKTSATNNASSAALKKSQGDHLMLIKAKRQQHPSSNGVGSGVGGHQLRSESGTSSGGGGVGSGVAVRRASRSPKAASGAKKAMASPISMGVGSVTTSSNSRSHLPH